MRVLPGMQSAFVEIGLERDAFLYVSDFFDEEEKSSASYGEIEKIHARRSQARSRRQIQKARLEREKQMEAVQEIAEPMRRSEPTRKRLMTTNRGDTREEFPAADKRDRGRGKSRRDKREKEARRRKKSRF
jgi:ribonuclease G